MHLLLIDWLHKIHLNADAAFATKRWKLAEAVLDNITRKEILEVLRVFLFSPSSPELIQALTRRFLEVDVEFPASKNVEDVRLQAGVVMLTAFERRTLIADIFALGIKASTFPLNRCKPAQLGIVEASAKYLSLKADALRPSNFGTTKDREAIAQKLEAFGVCVDDADERSKAQEELAATLDNVYGEKIRRLAEETGLLWWLSGGFSSSLNQKTSDLDSAAYALVMATEAAERTQILPPPPSINAILGRALAACKATKSQFALKEIVNSASPSWRSKFVAAHSVADYADVVPLITAIQKTEEGGISTLVKVLPKTCPGVVATLLLTPLDAATQLYNELLFQKAFNEFK